MLPAARSCIISILKEGEISHKLNVALCRQDRSNQIVKMYAVLSVAIYNKKQQFPRGGEKMRVNLECRASGQWSSIQLLQACGRCKKATKAARAIMRADRGKRDDLHTNRVSGSGGTVRMNLCIEFLKAGNCGCQDFSNLMRVKTSTLVSN